MAKAKFAKAQKAIDQHFADSRATVYTASDLSRILAENRIEWDLAQSTNRSKFTNFLIHDGILLKTTLNFPNRPVTVYSREDATVYEVASAILSKSYFTHSTAMFLHGLLEEEPRTTHLNREQGRKPSKRKSLRQAAVDGAFQRPARISSNCAVFGEFTIRQLNGMYTARLGVEELEMSNSNDLSVTDTERTLIDIAVRPAYSGGPKTVLDAYRRAAGKFSHEKLLEYLDRLDYTYPYHQAIGFYLERSVQNSKIILAKLEQMETPIIFYLEHQISEPAFSDRWQLFYPSGLA